MSSTGAMSIIVGTLCQFILDTLLPWRQAALVNCIGPVVCLILLSLIPETPIWLLSRGRIEEAKQSLAWLRGWTNVENIKKEFTEMSLSLENDSPREQNRFMKFTKIFEMLGNICNRQSSN